MQHLSHTSHPGRRMVGGLVTLTVILALSWSGYIALFAQDGGANGAFAAAFDTPTTSSPIAMTQDKSTIWVVNPDDGSVAVLGNLDGVPTVLTTVRNVGKEPQAIALDTGVGTAQRAYVVSPPDNSVFVLKVNSLNPFTVVVEKRLTTGAEPWNVVTSPDGTRIFVANSGQDTITMINAQNQSLAGSVDLRKSACNVDDQNRHFQPRGLAVTLDSRRLYVARFLSFTKPGGVQGADGGKEGVVCQLDIPADSTSLPTVATPIRLAPMDTGFKNPNGTAAISHPNQLQSVVIYRDQLYLPNIGASTGAPDRFNVSSMAHVNVIDNANSGTPIDAPGKTVNMHLGARDPEPGKKKLFFANPWGIAFRNNAGTVNAYAVSSGSDLLVKLNVDATGDLTFTTDISTTRYIDLNDPNRAATSGANAGKNPLGIVIRNNRAFVMNYISRNVSVVNLDSDSVEVVVKTTNLPSAGSTDEQLLVGKEIFFASRGHFDRPPGATVSTEDRLSSEGWQSCSSCHFAGLTDGNVWFFGAGPRKSVPLNASWSPHNPNDQRLLNYSAIFDEVQDFELNIRNTSGPGPLNAQNKPPADCATPAAGQPATSQFDPNHGLLFGDDGDINKSPCVVNQFAKPNAGRPQVTVTLPGSNTAWPALDAMKEWVRFSIRTPEGALTTAQLPAGNTTGGLEPALVSQGRRLFFRAQCQTCHGGTKWTTSNKDFTAPPAADLLVTEATTGVVPLQMFNSALFDIGSFNLNVAGEGNILSGQPAIGATEVSNAGLKALGLDHNGDGKGQGYNIPALLGIYALPPYYHNGACETLACVLSNQKHRTGNGKLPDVLTNPADQAKVIAWLETLDANTPFPSNLRITAHDIFVDPPVVARGQQVTIGANVSLFGTKADLADLLSDLGVASISARITVETSDGIINQDLSLTADAFRQDFGQAVISTTITMPANPTSPLVRITVAVDANNRVPEDKESDNNASRRLRLRNAAADTTPPVVQGAFISDDATFNDQDPFVTKKDVQVKIRATDGAGGSGVTQYCIVKYTYDAVERFWAPEACRFRDLPAPVAQDTFIVNQQIADIGGVVYAFVWVKDGAGNISSQPAFAVTSFIPSNAIRLNRNDVRIFRLRLGDGQSLNLTLTPDFGDVDVAVFDDFTNPNATLIAESAQSGATPEQVTLTGPGRFQVEVRAVVNSRFTVTTAEGVAVAAGTAPQAPLADGRPIVAGPPALRTAIEDDTELYLPLVYK